MWGGKSELLVKVAWDLPEARRFVPISDTRSGAAIKSRVHRCTLAAEPAQSLAEIPHDGIVILDELHLWAGETTHLRSRHGATLVAGIDYWHTGERVIPWWDLASAANVVLRLTARCACGKRATRTRAKSPQEGLVRVGDDYEPVCISCFQKPWGHP